MQLDKTDVLIVGGGVIGLCAAYYCLKKGVSVALVEKDEVGAGSSRGNAGLLVPSHCEPLSSPGAAVEGLRHLFDPYGPFTIKFAPDKELFSWLVKFLGYCNEKHVERAVESTARLARRSVELHRLLAREGGQSYDCSMRGIRCLYSEKTSFMKGVRHAEKLRDYGVESRVLPGERLRRLDSAVGKNVAGAVEYPGDGRLDPALFIEWMADQVKRQGGRIHEKTEALGFDATGRRIERVMTTRGDFHARQIVVCAGAWTPGLLRTVGLKLPVQGAKGYSVTFDPPEGMPNLPLLLEGPRIAVTPLRDSFRIAGVLELSGFDMRIDPKRIFRMRKQVQAFLPGMKNLKVREIWRGLRPCAPDGLPVIGRAGKYDNLWVATGHATKGMSLGPATGELIAGKITGEPPKCCDKAFSFDRWR